MPKISLSPLAEADLRDIALYTFQRWGEGQARRYIDDLRRCINRLAKSPFLGRSCDDIRSGYRRMEQGKHVVFYRLIDDGIFIARILHQGMLPGRHLLEET